MSARTDEVFTVIQWLEERGYRVERMTAEERRLAKYSRYNASRKGRERVDNYRHTAKGIFARWRAELNQRMSSHSAQAESLWTSAEALGRMK
jgi:hypothetical protein